MCMFALTVSTAKPKNIKEAMADSAWIEAMQMKLSISFVRTTSLGTRLTTYFGKNVIQANSGFYGKTKRMKIPYVIATSTTCSNGYVSRVWTVKTAFHYGPLKEERCMLPNQTVSLILIIQTSYRLGSSDMDETSFESLDFRSTNPHEYFYQSGQIQFRDYEKKWYGKMENGIGTPMATKPKLDADLSGEPVDQTDYRSKIGSLMYLTSSRPDIVQAVCYCARYQARPTEKHLKEVKRIFRYLKIGTHSPSGTIGNPKGSGFELTAFSDADHAGCIDTRKSTSGGISS
ncbi:hypothetical protein Tco_0418128 [Tanacetum coccineum]